MILFFPFNFPEGVGLSAKPERGGEIFLTEFDQAKEWLAKGIRFFTFQNDIRMLMDAGKSNTTQLRQFIQQKV